MSPVEPPLDADEARRQLYDLMRRDVPFERKAEQTLEIACAYLDVHSGYVTRIDPDENHWEAIASTDPPGGSIPAGLELGLRTTYCRRTIERDTITHHDVLEAGWDDDPAYEEHQLRCYHGRTVSVGDEIYGTVCFVDEKPREEPFDEDETMFTDLIARMLGTALERERHEATLAEREAELRRRQKQLRSLIDASFDAVFELDADGEFCFLSESVADVFEYDRSDLLGEHWTALLTDEAAIERGKTVLDRVYGGEIVEEFYVPLQTARSRTRYSDIRMAPIDANGEIAASESGSDVARIQGTIRDATRRRRYERLVTVLNRVLRHNLRNDMGIIRGYAEMLAEDADGERAVQLEQIVTTADRLLALSEKARKLQSPLGEEFQRRETRIDSIVRPTVSEITEAHPEASVSLEEATDASVSAAPSLEVAIRELLENAVKHGGETPTVTVSVSETPDSVTVEIADEGPGLQEIERAVLEDGTETPLRHGRGLGLWLVYWIVTSHDGTVDAHVTEEGTTMVITLPRSNGDGG